MPETWKNQLFILSLNITNNHFYITVYLNYSEDLVLKVEAEVEVACRKSYMLHRHTFALPGCHCGIR